jgi:hypothetical protein
MSELTKNGLISTPGSAAIPQSDSAQPQKLFQRVALYFINIHLFYLTSFSPISIHNTAISKLFSLAIRSLHMDYVPEFMLVSFVRCICDCFITINSAVRSFSPHSPQWTPDGEEINIRFLYKSLEEVERSENYRPRGLSPHTNRRSLSQSISNCS